MPPEDPIPPQEPEEDEPPVAAQPHLPSIGKVAAGNVLVYVPLPKFKPTPEEFYACPNP
jgi:hypothetical protein